MPLLLFLRSVGVVLKVALYQNYWGALVAGAGGQVAQGAQKVGKPARGGTLGGHAALQVGVLFAYGVFYCRAELLALEIREVVISKVLELQLVGQAVETVGEAGGHHGD